MDLVIGGFCQGKRAYVRKNYEIGENDMVSGEHISLTEAAEGISFTAIAGAGCIYDFHKLAPRLLKEGIDPSEWTRQFLKNHEPAVVITNEVGNGVVPVDAFEREWREAAGRMSCILAEHAGNVIRVTCGLGQKIKQQKIK